jgi:hypothetical protein
MPSRFRGLPGLTVAKWVDGWRIVHVASRLPLHTGEFLTKGDAAAAVGGLAALAVDWDQPADAVRAAIDRAPGGRAMIERLVMPPPERERRRRIAANSTRYLRWLEAAGEHVVDRTCHGLAGTVYRISCGCHRVYSINLAGPESGEPSEELIVRCGRHRDLTVPAEPTDTATIGRQMRGTGRPASRRPHREQDEIVRPADAEAAT